MNWSSDSAMVKQVAMISISNLPLRVQIKDYVQSRWQNVPLMRYPVEIGVLLEGRLRRHYGDYHRDLEAGEMWFTGMWEPIRWEVLQAPCRELVFFVTPEILLDLQRSQTPRARWLLPFVLPPEERPQIQPHQREQVLAIAQSALAFHDRGEKLLAQTGQGNTLGGDRSGANYSSAKLFGTSSGADFSNQNLEFSGEQAPLFASDALALQLQFSMLQLFLLAMEEWRFTPENLHPGRVQIGSNAGINPAIYRVFEKRGPVTVKEAAHLCGLNRNLFARRFREAMGVGFAEFGLNARLSGIARDLVETGETVKRLAARWGFANSSHLHRRFVERYGCTPAEHRRRLREELPTLERDETGKKSSV